jgi:hypothetical protein
MTCAVCNQRHFLEGRITRAFSKGQGVLWPSIDKVDLSRINSLTGKNLQRGVFGRTSFFLDCRYFRVTTGVCPLPGQKFKMGLANTDLIVGEVHPTTQITTFTKCAEDLKPISQYSGHENWMNSTIHMVDLNEFLDSYERLAPDEFLEGCIDNIKSLWP